MGWILVKVSQITNYLRWSDLSRESAEPPLAWPDPLTFVLCALLSTQASLRWSNGTKNRHPGFPAPNLDIHRDGLHFEFYKFKVVHTKFLILFGIVTSVDNFDDSFPENLDTSRRPEQSRHLH